MKPNTNELPIGMTLHYAPSGDDAHEFYEAVARAGSGYRAYAFRPSGGGIGGAALDFYIMLEGAAAVAGIASFIWTLYRERYPARQPDPPRDRPVVNLIELKPRAPSVYMVIHRPDGHVIELTLGPEIASREDFVRQFQSLVEASQNLPENRLQHEKTIAAIEHSPNWVRLDDKPQNQTDKKDA